MVRSFLSVLMILGAVAAGWADDLEMLEAPTDGTIKGRVILQGDAPKSFVIEAMKKGQDAKFCQAGEDYETHDQTWIVGKDKGVANVLVRLVPPAGKKFKPIEDNGEVLIDVPHCTFVPHIVALRPGQVLNVSNTSRVVHAPNITGDLRINPPRVVAIPPGNSKVFILKPQPEPVRLTCQIHRWMQALVFVADHPYVTTTDKNGAFELKNVPAGVIVTLEGVHEAGKVEGVRVRVRSGLTAEQELKITLR